MPARLVTPSMFTGENLLPKQTEHNVTKSNERILTGDLHSTYSKAITPFTHVLLVKKHARIVFDLGEQFLYITQACDWPKKNK